ncbi:MAG: dTMP kinase [Fibrella sp.]|nr:dTMP kinase [Armatimonadota bacterium]
MGVFLTFEGPEGAGKTTQIARLAETLAGRGYSVTRTREPGGDPFGERVRALLLDRDASPTPIAELLLFAAARAQNVKTVIRPALDSGHIVLCDRFTDSTLAYQGFGRGVSPDAIHAVNSVATEGLIPRKTFLLDLPPHIGLARQSPDAQDRLDRETLDFHERVRAGFLGVAAAEPERVVILDATQDPDTLFAQLFTAVLPLLPQP